MRGERLVLPIRCPKCVGQGGVLCFDEYGFPGCTCGWRDYGTHAPPIDDDGERHWARAGYHLARGERR